MCQLALLLQQRRHEQTNNKEKDDNNDSKAQDHKSEVTTEAPVTVTCNSSNLAAVNVELWTFAQAGVLESEVTILHFLHDSLPPQTVPVYMGHYKLTNYVAIVMEYLPGEDMNQLRETIVRGGKSRRLHVQDALSWGAHPFLLSMSALITPNTIGSSQWIIGQASWVELCLKSMTRRWAWMWHSLRTQPWACHYGNNSFQGILNLRDCRTSSQCSSSNTGGKW